MFQTGKSYKRGKFFSILFIITILEPPMLLMHPYWSVLRLNFKYMKNSMHADYFIFWQ